MKPFLKEQTSDQHKAKEITAERPKSWLKKSWLTKTWKVTVDHQRLNVKLFRVQCWTLNLFYFRSDVQGWDLRIYGLISLRQFIAFLT